MVNFFISSTGVEGPSARTRMLSWLRHTDAPRSVSTYLGRPYNSRTAAARDWRSHLGAEWHLRRLRPTRSDTVFLHREASPFLGGRLEARLVGTAGHGVYDFDDALYLQHDAVTDRRDKARRASSAADVVVAGNEILAGWAGQFCSDVRIIPTCIEPEDYAPEGPDRRALDLDPRRHMVWLGTSTGEDYLAQMSKELLEVHARTGLRLAVISSGRASLGPLDRIVDRIQWWPGVTHHLSDFAIALGPLRDDAWARGKCSYKLLQYAAAGVPFVASPVGMNAEVAERFGMPAPTATNEWADAITSLYGSTADRREEVGASMRSDAAAGYSYRAWLPAWLDALGLSASHGAATA